MSLTPRLFILDISAFIFRAYHAVRPLQNSKGIPTNAVYGVVTMVNQIIKSQKPDYLVVVFDSPKPSFRKEMYPAYKANRPPPPEDLSIQFPLVKKFFESYPLVCLQKDGFEADDLIATLAKRACHKGIDSYILSSDKDLLQLVEPHINIFDPVKQSVVNAAAVEEKWGVPPEKMADLLALMGDTSDNIPGVAGVGPKKAAKLLKFYGSLEEILKQADAIQGKEGEAIRASRDVLDLSKKLVLLKEDIDISLDLESWKITNPDSNKLQEFYKEMEFRSLGASLASSTINQEETTPSSADASPVSVQKSGLYELVTTEEQLNQWAKKISDAPFFAFDTETDSLDPRRARLVGLSLSVKSGEGCYIPLEHSYLGCPAQLPAELVKKVLGCFFADPLKKKGGQNSKFDKQVLENVGYVVEGISDDSMIMSYLLSPETPHNLDVLSANHLNHETIKFDQVVPKGGTFDQVDIEKACQYSAEDADVAFSLIEKFTPQIKEAKLETLYRTIEMPLLGVLSRMESRGVKVDTFFLENLGAEIRLELASLEKESYQVAGVEFNLASPKQVGHILFEKLGLPTIRKTKTGFSTDADVLEELSTQHQLPRLLLKHRLLSKLISTYVDQLRTEVNPKTERLHTRFNQTVAATGRLSSSDPNLQNIPIRSVEGRKIRQAFVAPDGFILLSADYSQIELRLLAALSQEPTLKQAFAENKDIHKMTAAEIFSKDEFLVTADERAIGKTVNFGVVYGQTPFGLAQQLGISNGEAKHFIESFYKRYPVVATYREQILEEVRRTGEVFTWQGRRRLIPDINSKNPNVRNNAERNAFNTLFQGSAADLIKVAMIRIDEKLRSTRAGMILQVHDELIVEVPLEQKDEVATLVKHEMENALPCEVPLKVDIGFGQNWGEAH